MYLSDKPVNRLIDKFNEFTKIFRSFEFLKSTNRIKDLIMYSNYELKSVVLKKSKQPHLKLCFTSPIDVVNVDLFAWKCEQDMIFDFAAKSFIMTNKGVLIKGYSQDKYFNTIYNQIKGWTELAISNDISDNKNLKSNALDISNNLNNILSYHKRLEKLQTEFGLDLRGFIPVTKIGKDNEMLGLDGSVLEIGIKCPSGQCRKKCTECQPKCETPEHAFIFLPINIIYGICVQALKDKSDVKCPFCRSPLKILYKKVPDHNPVIPCMKKLCGTKVRDCLDTQKFFDIYAKIFNSKHIK